MIQNTAEKHNRLTLIRLDAGRTSDGHKLALWSCECGGEKLIAASRVRRGTTRSCGCLMVTGSVERASTHGMRYTREYSTWIAMVRRCTDPNHKDYPRYGGAGVPIDPLWVEAFQPFFDHIGPRPDGTTIDRIKPDLGYVPGNVRWATPVEQAINRRDVVLVNTPRGRMPLVTYADLIGLSRGAAHQRLKRGKLEGVTL